MCQGFSNFSKNHLFQHTDFSVHLVFNNPIKYGDYNKKNILMIFLDFYITNSHQNIAMGGKGNLDNGILLNHTKNVLINPSYLLPDVHVWIVSLNISGGSNVCGSADRAGDFLSCSL